MPLPPKRNTISKETNMCILVWGLWFWTISKNSVSRKCYGDLSKIKIAMLANARYKDNKDDSWMKWFKFLWVQGLGPSMSDQGHYNFRFLMDTQPSSLAFYWQILLTFLRWSFSLKFEKVQEFPIFSVKLRSCKCPQISFILGPSI